jgi:hypothetical protein
MALQTQYYQLRVLGIPDVVSLTGTVISATNTVSYKKMRLMRDVLGRDLALLTLNRVHGRLVSPLQLALRQDTGWHPIPTTVLPTNGANGIVKRDTFLTNIL